MNIGEYEHFYKQDNNSDLSLILLYYITMTKYLSKSEITDMQ